MSKEIITHVGWLAVAAGAFVMGKSLTQDSNPHQASNSGQSATQTSAAAAAKTASSGSKTSSKAGKAADDALSWLNGFRSPDGTISSERMASAVKEAIQEGDPVKSSMYFAQLLEELNSENAESAFKAVRETATGFEGMRFMPLLGYAWGQKDGKAAMAAFDAVGGREAGFGKASVMTGWASENPDEAIAFRDSAKAARAKDGEAETAANGPGGRGRGPGPGGEGDDWIMERGIVTGLSRRSIDEALQYIGKMPEEQKGQYIGVVTDQKLKEGVSVAAAWAQGLTDSSMKREALQEVSRHWMRQDMTAAADWAVSVASQPEASRAVQEIADQMAEKNRADAYTWAAKLPDGAAKAEAYGEVFGQWAREDAVAASQELAKLPNGEVKNEAIQDFSRNLARSEPVDAMTWATSITDEASRLETQIEVARQWNRSNPEEAKAWIASNLPAEAQKQALEPDRGRWGGPPGGGGFGGRGPGGGR